MFAPRDFNGAAFDRDYAERRSRWEPVMEVTQYKGDSETHPLNSPEDEFAGYEIWDRINLGGMTPQTPQMQPFQYARSALRIGLQQEAALGVNPFKFGLIGSTDAHTGFAAAEENNFWGKSTKGEPAPGRWHESLFDNPTVPELTFRESDMAASGYMAVWARENTRAAIFEAMKRREVYATTGPRIALRFFGGYGFAAADASAPDLAATGYARGVPMGSDLPAASAGTAPTFLVAAARDALSGKLDRIQIVKGWLDAKGETHERVYDVAWSGERKPDRKGRLPPVGNTVDVEERELEQQHRRGRAVDGMDRPRFRSSRARVLVRACDRDPHAALDRLRPQVLRRRDAGLDTDDHAGARLQLADLVHALDWRERALRAMTGRDVPCR
jgi:hypothetical protein